MKLENLPAGGRCAHGRRGIIAIAGAVALALAGCGPAGGSDAAGVRGASVEGALAAASASPRIDLEVLVLEAGWTPETEAWKATLERLGTPFDTINVSSQPLTAERLSDGASHAKYNAVILARPDTLPPDQQAILEEFESRFGIRQIVAYTWGWGWNGLSMPFHVGLPSWWNGAPLVGTLTDAGRRVFPYLAGSLPFEDQWGVLARPDPAASFETLVAGPDGAAVVGIHTYPDGREEMVTTIEYSIWDLDQKALLEGQLAWVTRGVYLGYWRNYLSMHFDDVLFADDRWSPVLHADDEALPPIRMTPADVARAASWSSANGFRLDLVFNGLGATPVDKGNGVRKGKNDPLTTALLASRATFGWISHTWSHEDLDAASLKTGVDEIRKNVTWATANGVPADPAELVTGGHTGLSNPLFAAALARTGVGAVAADASYGDAVRSLGATTVVPRHPTHLAYNVGTRAEQLDEFNWIYRADPWVQAPVSWERYLDIAASSILGFAMANDPRPHFAHQNNLAEEGTFYDLFDAVLQRYRTYFSVPPAQPTLTEAGELLVKSDAWRKALQAGQVTAWVQDGAVQIATAVPVAVPVAGTTAGTVYGGLRSGWVEATPATVLSLPLAP